MKVKDGQVIFDLESLLHDEKVLAELAKSAVFDEKLLTCISQILVSGEVVWNDEEDGVRPWWWTWTGKGERFEEARQIVAGLADQVAQKLIADLTKERDELHKKSEDRQREIWKLQAEIRDLRRKQVA
ncbi:MAG TPA: hypothetical protein VJ302_26900 [Blastocatellia bacterium]|nr:hypothetical protein [Blastocatellia bacterium]